MIHVWIEILFQPTGISNIFGMYPVTEGQIKRCGSNPEPKTKKPIAFSPPGQASI